MQSSSSDRRRAPFPTRFICRHLVTPQQRASLVCGKSCGLQFFQIERHAEQIRVVPDACVTCGAAALGDGVPFVVRSHVVEIARAHKLTWVV